MDKIISSSPSLLHGSSSGSRIGATWGDVKHPNLSLQAMEIVGKHAPGSAPKHKLKVRSSSSPPTLQRVSYGQGQGSKLASHTVHHELYDAASGIGRISVKRRRLDDGTAETDIAMPSWVINTLVKRVVRAMRGKPKSGASQGSDKDVPNVPIDSQPERQSEDARSEAATGVVGVVLSQLRMQSAAHCKELLLLKGAHQALGSEATKAMEVACEASQKAQQASETAGWSAATAKWANTRTTALRNDVSHINKGLADHEAATRADGEALRGRIQALEEGNAAGGSHSPPSNAAAEVRAANVTIEVTKRDVAAMSAEVKAAVAAGELLRGTKAVQEGLQVEVRSARSGGAQHTKDNIEITETVRNVNETATLALQGAKEATAAIDKIQRDAAATRETAIVNSKHRHDKAGGGGRVERHHRSPRRRQEDRGSRGGQQPKPLAAAAGHGGQRQDQQQRRKGRKPTGSHSPRRRRRGQDGRSCPAQGAAGSPGPGRDPRNGSPDIQAGSGSRTAASRRSGGRHQAPPAASRRRRAGERAAVQHAATGVRNSPSSATGRGREG